MADIITPNMSLTIPTVGPDGTPSPDWAEEINGDLSILDSHNHTSGRGAPIPPSGLLINADLPFNNNNATTLRSTRFTVQGSTLSQPADLGALYVTGVDLYYNDAGGNVVRITQNGSVTGSAGTITGLPSGTASAAYSGGIFTFQSATNTPAFLNVGPVTIGLNVVNSKTITLTPAAGMPANYTLTFPAVSPDTNQILVADNSGNLSWVYDQIGRVPLGTPVPTFPALTGAYVCVATTAADAAGFVLCQGQTIVDATSPMNGTVIPNINNSVFLMGSSTSNVTGGANDALVAHTHVMTHAHANTFSLGGTVATGAHTHDMAHVHSVGYIGDNAGQTWLNYTSVVTNSTTSQGQTQILRTPVYTTASTSSPTTNITFNLIQVDNTQRNLYSTGALSAAGVSKVNTGAPSATTSLTGAVTDFTGSTASGGSGSDSRPKFISAVYAMRIK